MKIFARIAVRIVYVAATLAVVAAAAWGQASKQTSERTSQQLSDQLSHKEQCSLAVVSRLVGGNQPVCDGVVVRQMAKRGHAFEQNQMGLASVLAVGPDYSEKEALAWFEHAAQKGYAPAQVNLAVMNINGWGTATNYAVGLHWLQAAADQGPPNKSGS